MRRIAALTLASLTWTCGSCEQPEPEPDGIAQCKVVNGDVRSRTKKKVTWDTLEVGHELFGGDWVQTGEASRTSIVFTSGSELTIEETSMVLIRQPRVKDRQVISNEISVESGTVRGKMPEGSAKTLVSMPDGNTVTLAPTSDSGTVRYRVVARADGVVEVAVTEGQAQVIGADGTPSTLEAGQARDVRGGVVSGKLIQLPGFPDLLTPGVDANVVFREGLGVRMSWSDIPDTTYVVEVTDDQSFTRMVERVVSETEEWLFEPKSVGTYYWRVAARNAQGRQGEFGFGRRLFVTEGQALSLLVGPPDGARVGYAKQKPMVKFTWRAVEPPSTYKLVVAMKPDLQTDVVISETTVGQGHQTRKLGRGTYYWGVFAQGSRANRPLFTKPRKLIIERKVGITFPEDIKWR